MTVFSPAEMRRRLEAFRRRLADRQVDVAFLHTADNVFYLSGVPLLSEWGRPMWAVVPAAGASAICGAQIELENMQRHSALDEVLSYGDEESVVAASLRLCSDFISRLKSGGGRLRIGLERALLPCGIHEELMGRLAGCEFVEIGDLVGELRLVKSPEEIAILELGGQLAKIGADAFLNALHESVSELAVAAHAIAEINKAMGALSPDGLTSTYAYAQFGDHTLTPHLHPTSRRLRRGDLVALNVFPVVWGYCAELERTFVFGEPTAEQRRPLEAVNEAFEAGKVAMKPGGMMSEIDRLTRAILDRHGLGRYIRHGTGHAHGIMIGAAGREENGELRLYNSTRLAANMANSVEPGVYIPEIGGFRHSDVMIITEDGARCITEFPRDLGV